ncbi:amidohydrolase family protein [Deinococcus maricopensis]|nr:amidohydrolase family protein [Deinococcus maricopensis]
MTPTLALTGRLLDPLRPTLTEDGVLLIAGDRIVASGPRATTPIPDGVPTLQGGTLLPGLMDLHVHARPAYASWFPRAGVTTVRDAASSLENLRALRTHPGAPRMFGAGPALDGPGSIFAQFGPGAFEAPGDPVAGGWCVRTPEDAIRAVDALADAGVDTVKLYEQLTPDAYRAAAARAHARELPVMTDLGTAFTRGLSGAQVDALQAIACGVRSIEHVSGYALAYQRLGGDPLADSLNAAHLDHLARVTVDHGVTLVPTLVNLAGFAGTLEPLTLNTPAGPALDGLQHQWSYLRALPDSMRAAALADLRLAVALCVRVLDLGGRVVAGTDTPAAPDVLPGAGLHAELRLFAALLGLSPARALQAATTDAAGLLGRADLGTLQPGTLADVLIVDGRPDVTLADAARVRHVVQAGVPATVA